jgi:D-glycero-D-manno-heptose 1,7-bisphosphate phosphatase
LWSVKSLRMAERPPVETAFLDRDGTINVKAPEGDYIKTPDELDLLPGAAEAIRLLNEARIRTIVVTNQRGIARGLMSADDLAAIHALLRSRLAAADASLDAIYYCPHEEGECDCRKPRTGMFVAARRDFLQIDFASSVVIGDSMRDVEAANAIGAKAVRVGGDTSESLLDVVQRLLSRAPAGR